MTKILGIVKEGKLIPEELWIKFVTSLENDFNSLETNSERAKRELAEAIINSVKRRTSQKFGVLFSGGVDSSLIAFVCRQLKCNFTCYTVGIEGSDDIVWAQKAAKEYDFDFKYKILSLDEFEIVLRDVVKLLNDADIVKASVGSVLYSAGKLALSNGNSILFGGLGSEEIFAGYQRHEDALGSNNANSPKYNKLGEFAGLKIGGQKVNISKPPIFNNFEALHKECWNGLKNMWQRDLTRDFAIAKKLGLDLRTPFLDKDVIKTAMNIHPMYKLDNSNKKIILREAAEFIGLKKEFAWRKKQAAQYGSNFVNGIEKLAKRNGFKYKKDYLTSLLK